jgi:hypothetical protein
VALVSLPALVCIGVYVYLTVYGAYELAAAISETDRLDPRWRFEDVEADRAVVPDAENSATVVTATKQLMPAEWPYWEFSVGANGAPDPPDAPQRRVLDTSFSELEPQRQLNDYQAAVLRTEIMRAAQALAEAHRLVDMTEGRYPIIYSADSIFTPRPALGDARAIVHLLSCDALLQAQDNDQDGAIESCRAALNAARSIGDEPLMVSLLIRIACRAVPVGQAERVLAQGEPSEATLQRLQGLLEREDSEPLLLNALRGERARIDRFMEGLAAGRVMLSEDALKESASLAGEDARAAADRLALMRWWPGAGALERAAMLRYTDQAVEIAKMPPEKWPAEFSKWDAAAKKQPLLVRMLALAYLGKISDSDLRTEAYLRSAIAAIAAERYRRALGHWPDALDNPSLARYLPHVPADPYDGQPLRWRRLGDAVVVYSIGPDRADNGGNLARHGQVAPGTDIGIRLWDPAKRRQPAAPLPPLPPKVDFGP